MRASDRRAWLSMAVVTTVLTAVLVFLYARTQYSGESDYFQNVTLLRHLKQLDAQWELDVLKSRIGITAHYDSLADSLTELNALLERFESDMGTQPHDDSVALGTAAATLRGVIQEKAGLIEHFKSSNSVLRNSLAFLPTAAEDIQQTLDRTDGAGLSASISKRVSMHVNHLLLASMLYSQSTSDDRGAEIQRGLEQIAADRHLLPGDIGERMDIFGAHVGTILREQKSVNDLLGNIAAVPTAARIDEVGNALGAEQRRASVQNQRYREYLLIFSAVLIGLFLYAAVRLVRSHAVINRVNEELQGANEHLERRVQERTHELRLAQSELVKTAHRAGMAEIATNVLHNVGNVLNSVNVSARLVASNVRASKAPGLARAVQLMNEHADDLGFLSTDAKGKMLPGYLDQLAHALAAEQHGVVEELAVLTKSVDHIREIIATQQAHAGTSSLVEPMRICELVEDALRINATALERRRVTVEKAFSPVPELPLDKGRILQILVNLISNAKQAVQSLKDREPRIRLSVERAPDGMLRVGVADNGVGIAAANLTRVFAHGFTTKADGHGFGLHSAVIAAHEMGGTLTAHSDGPDTGAIFTLELPIKSTEDVP